MNKLQFPAGFEWGSATASAQIEGAWNEGGKSESIWDRFCTQPGAVLNGDTTHVACDHYHRFEEDIEIMRTLGLKHYRLSLAWPRILPAGRGAINPQGVAFYRRLLTALRNAGIKPAVTLFHWDLPQVLQDEGGWAVRQTAYDFEAYAKVCFQEFGDLVDRWITINEPAVVVWLGYDNGQHAPGIKQPKLAMQVAHHLLLGHGLAVRALRASGKKSEIGITLNMAAAYPLDPANPDDRLAAEIFHKGSSTWYADPVIKGGYPTMVASQLRADGLFPEVQPGDFEIIRSPSDFLGLNYYTGLACQLEASAEKPYNFGIKATSREKTDIGWEIYPQGLFELLHQLSDEYPGMPLYITENGASYDDPIVNGQVNDSRRIAYLQAHFAAAHRAITQGVPLKGYYVWSLMDNFEWAYGYSQRFGMVHVDYQTQKRTPKQSALWYSEVMKNNGLEF